MGRQVRYIYKQVARLSPKTANVMFTKKKKRKSKSIYKGRQSQSNSKQICKAETANVKTAEAVKYSLLLTK